MSSLQLKFQAAVLSLGVFLIVACEESDGLTIPDCPEYPNGFNDCEDLGQCILKFKNDTGYVLTHGMFFPTDSFGIMKDLPDLPIEQSDTRTMILQVGVYQMMVNHQVYEEPPYYYFTSFDHECVRDQTLEVTATIEDLQIGMLEVINVSGFTLTSVLLASTDDLIFRDNVLDGALEDGEETDIYIGEGRFYWLLEDSEGNNYFGSTYSYGSVGGWATAISETKIDSDDLCTLTLTNSTGVTIDYIYIVAPGPIDWENFWPNDQVLDSRGNLPDSQSLDILVAPGTWTLGASNYYGSYFLITDLVCSDGQPLTETLTQEDIQ